MKRPISKHLTAVALTALGVLTGVTACAESESILFVKGVALISGSGDDCVVTADDSQVIRLGGTFDTAFGRSYRAVLVVGNQVVKQGSREKLRTETSNVVLQGAEVELTDPGGSSIGPFTAVGAGLIAGASSGESPGYGAVGVELIPAGISMAPGQWVANIKVFGKTLGGSEVESGVFSYPITVCRGCLVIDAYDPASLPSTSCNAPVDTATKEEGRCDDFGSDTPATCRACAAISPDVCNRPISAP